MSDDVASGFFAGSIYGAQTRRGLVELRLGSERETVMPTKAREIAAMILEAAGAADGDEILMRVLERAGMSVTRAAHVLMAVRQERAIVYRRARDDARRSAADYLDPDDGGSDDGC